MYYDASADRWNSYVPGRADHFNDLDNWDYTMGIWIRVTGDATLSVEGYKPTSTDITLYPGWNIIGYPSETIRIASDTLPDEVAKIGVFSRYEQYNTTYFDDLSIISLIPGRGYCVYNSASEPVIWTLVY
ncbi:MAG: hypothetical protein R6U17_03560 [Thermoplasmata archaeon]